jgi:hypothetical protein
MQFIGSRTGTFYPLLLVGRFYGESLPRSPMKCQADIVSSQERRISAATQTELASLAQKNARRFSPEFELLLACCGSPEATLTEALALHINWERLLALAEHHRLIPALYQSVENRDDFPLNIRSVLKARFHNHIQKVLRFSAALTRVTRRFAEHDIPVLAHKGPVMSQQLYGDTAQRQFGDLDFLVLAKDVVRARSALMELGYRPKLTLSPRQEKAYLRSGYEYVFGLGSDRNLLELQWQIVPRFYAIAFDMEALIRRSVVMQFEGTQVRTLSNEDLLLVLCVHAAKHEWTQLAMVRDIAALAKFAPDWHWIEAEARRLAISKIIAVSLRLAHSLLGCELRLKSDPADARHLAQTVQSRLATGAESNPESLGYFRFMMQSRERWRDRLRFLWRLAVTPSVGEWQAVTLPGSSFVLYRVVRLLRLSRRFESLTRRRKLAEFPAA